MRRWALLISMALVPLLSAGQVVVTPSGYATTTGPAVPVAQPGAPLVMTPEITFRTVSPSPVGATNATANNIAGATNATITPPVVSASPSVVEYVSPYPTLVGAGSEYGTVQAPAASAPSGVSTRLAMFDRGAAQFNSAYEIGVPQPDMSLGEVAREWRQKKATTNARTYTNEDINRIQQQYGPPGGGVSGTAVNAGTSTTQPATSNEPASSVGAPAPPPTTTPENAPPAQPAPATPPPQASAPQPPPQQSALATVGAQTQQQSNAQEQAAAPAQDNNGVLPNTASPLPLLVLAGVAAASVGIVSWRMHKAN